ncbi:MULTISPECIES: glycosyltransferase 87 family protein [Thermomonospora]|uniref:Alpha-1,2-mannosyltransferase n=1 Tax=Thermomonospora cellulosilytica TaxID=1411118 RepID=A0A7W3MUS5_9ACTN|nr:MULTISPECIES: glycosyltransferase 87 family protein [Thermomonospora]MBA9002285.1 alpha-1,2-mannosyltransferase [Thermomonospora cellulosilytica]
MGGRSGDGTVTRARRSPADLAILVAGVLVAVAAVAPIAVHWLTNPPDQRLVDVDVYRSGGEAVLRGAPLYEFLTEPPQLLPFTYPPFAALLAVPLALLPWSVVQVLWVVAIYAALAVGVRYAFRPLIDRAGRYAPLVTGALVGGLAYLQPVHDQTRFGQVGLFLMALCAADCLAPSTRWPRGVLVGLATAIKLVPGVFLIYFLITGRRQAAWNATLTAAAASLLAFMVLPHDSLAFWFDAMLNNDRVGANNGTTNQSLNGMLLRLYWPDALTSLLWLACVALLAFLGFRLARRASLAATRLEGARAHSAELAGIAITGLLSVLLSPVGWVHHLVWVVLVLGALVGDGRDLRRWLVAVPVAVFFAFRIPWWGTRLIGEGHGAVERFTGRIVQDAFGLAAIALIWLLGRWLIDRLQSQTGPAVSSPEKARVGTLAP